MDKEQLLALLKENLSIKVDQTRDSNMLTIGIYFDKELIMNFLSICEIIDD